jgi:hypothetical protein
MTSVFVPPIAELPRGFAITVEEFGCVPQATSWCRGGGDVPVGEVASSVSNGQSQIGNPSGAEAPQGRRRQCRKGEARAAMRPPDAVPFEGQRAQ